MKKIKDASPKNQQLTDLANLMWPKAADFRWIEVKLPKYEAAIEVCSPVLLPATLAQVRSFSQLAAALPASPGDPLRFYVPFTAQETMELAKAHSAWPLTRAVAHQVHASPDVARFPRNQNQSAAVSDQAYDFLQCTKYLEDKYVPNHGKKLVSGAHKLWILSNKKYSTNHGFYIDRDAKKGVNPGKASLDPRFDTIQNLGPEHDEEHWDYSQLLQLMRNLRVRGQSLDIGDAVLTGHPAVWDEEAPLVVTPKLQKNLPLASVAAAQVTASAQLAGWWTVQYFGRTEFYLFPKKAPLNAVTWTTKKPASKDAPMSAPAGTGHWIVKDNKLVISWASTGSVDRWDLSVVGTADRFPITVNAYKGDATRTF